MKKAIGIFLILLLFLITYFLQVNIFNYLKIFEVKPNLFIEMCVIIGLFTTPKYGFISGIVSGLLLDIYAGTNIGTSAIMLGLVGLISGIIEKNFTKESRITQMVIIFISTIVYEIGIYILRIMFLNISLEILSVIKIVFVEALYNCILSIIFYSIMLKIGKILEGIYKENKRNSFYLR